MPEAQHGIPAELAQAVSNSAGTIALVVGAGCSLEHPTNLKLSDFYARKIHAQLIQQGVLSDGDCGEPSDLSAVASAVWARRNSQELVVSQLPRADFRFAQPNDGYLVAAALMREGAVATFLTLNFDLAMTAALGRLSAGSDVSVVESPEAVRDLGSRVVVYLHRNVNEHNFDKWVLRSEAITEEWKGHWEEVLAQRVLTSPIVVFAGLGSRAAVLTETLTWIRSRIDLASHRAYVVDPAADSQFRAELQLADDAHIELGWCDFMALLDVQMSETLRRNLEDTCHELCAANSWDDDLDAIAELCEAFFEGGLVASGQQRARWLLHSSNYLPDSEHVRSLVAYLLLGVGIAQRNIETQLSVRTDGVVELRRDGELIGSCLPASGTGTHHWTAIEPKIHAALARMTRYELPRAVLIAGLQGSYSSPVTPPTSVDFELPLDDIIGANLSPSYVMVDEIRAEPSRASQMVM